MRGPCQTSRGQLGSQDACGRTSPEGVTASGQAGQPPWQSMVPSNVPPRLGLGNPNLSARLCFQTRELTKSGWTPTVTLGTPGKICYSVQSLPANSSERKDL